MDQTKIDAFNQENARKAELQGHTDQVVNAVGQGNDTVTKSIHDLMLATMVAKDPRMVEVAQNLGDLLQGISNAAKDFKGSNLNLLPFTNRELSMAITQLAEGLNNNDANLQSKFDALNENIQKVASNQPIVNVPETNVQVNLDPLIKAIKANKPNDVKIPKFETKDLIDAVTSVQQAVNSLRFPVSNFLLPFKDINGKDTQVTLDASGNVPTVSTGGAAGTQYAELATTAPGTGTLALGRYKTAAPSLTDGQLYGLQLDTSGNLKVTGSLSVGGTTDNSAFTANTSTGTPTMGFYHSSIDTVTDGRAAAVGITNKRAMLVTLQTSAGADTGVAAVPLQVSLANTGANSNKLLVTPDSVALPANQSVNVSQINAVTPLMGNGVTGTGSQRVTIASDNTAFSVNSTLTAETTKVIGVTRTADGSGNLLSSTASALDINIKSGSIANTAFTANAGTNLNTSALALDATLTGGTQTTRLTDGTNTATVKAASTAAVAADKAVVVAISPNNTIPVSLTSTTVTGTVAVTQSTSPWVTSNATTSVVGNGAAATAQRVTLANDSTGIIATVGAVTAITNALPVGANVIGQVSINQTTLGTTNNVSVSGSTGAGTSALTKDDPSFGDGVTTGILSTTTRLYNGTNYDRQRSTPGVTGAQAVGGFTASGSALAAAPLTGGGLAKTANPTAVTDGQVVNSLHDKLGKQVVVGSIRDLKVQQTTTITASTAETTVLSSVASTFLDVYGVIVANSSATAASVTFKDATAGTTRFTIYVPAGDTRGFMVNESAGYNQAAVTNNWTATSSASVTSLFITIMAVKNT